MNGTLLVKADSALPNYRETISGIQLCRVRLGLRFSLHVVGALEQGLRNSLGTKGEGRGLFCNSCLNKLCVTVTVTVSQSDLLRYSSLEMPSPYPQGYNHDCDSELQLSPPCLKLQLEQIIVMLVHVETT
jgi:hypothetical protein